MNTLLFNLSNDEAAVILGGLLLFTTVFAGVARWVTERREDEEDFAILLASPERLALITVPDSRKGLLTEMTGLFLGVLRERHPQLALHRLYLALESLWSCLSGRERRWRTFLAEHARKDRP